MSAITVEDLHAVIEAGKLPEKDLKFANDLVRKGRVGTLSAEQFRWVGILLRQATSKAPEKVKGGFSKVYDLFQTASQHLKYPKVLLQLPNAKPLQLYRSGERSRIPGVITITDGGRYGENVFYGRVMPDGVFNHNRSIPEEELVPVRALLARFGKNPEAVASEYGKLTGCCCFCVRRLSDARSIEVGYGPVCAAKYSLRWGN